MAGHGCKYFATGFARRHWSVAWSELGYRGFPPVRQITGQHALVLNCQRRVRLAVRLQLFLPCLLLDGSARKRLPEERQYLVWYIERLFKRPAELLPGEPYLLIAQRRPMGFKGVLLVWAAVADVRSHADQ